MGKLQNGILDGFSGKVGTVVGSTWKGIPVMRARPRLKKNRSFSQAQQEQPPLMWAASQAMMYIPILRSYLKMANSYPIVCIRVCKHCPSG